MRDVREVMRLYREGGQAVREIARLSGVARSTVRDMIVRFERSGLAWPVPLEISDAELAARLYGVPGVKPGRRKQPEPDGGGQKIPTGRLARQPELRTAQANAFFS